MAARRPPSLPGLPFIGHIFDYRRNHLAIFWKSYRALGRIFSLQLGPQRMAVMVGPEAHHHFFSEVDKILSLPEVNRFVVPMFGKVLNASEDYDVRRSHLALLHSAFHPRVMPKHVETMQQETLRWFDQIGDCGEFDLYESFSSLAMRIAASALMGPEIRQCLDQFIPLMHDLARGMEFILPPNLPLPRFRRRDRARKQLHELIKPIIAQRRSEPDRHDDFFQVIVNGNDGTGGGEANETTIGLALMTVFTAYIATAAQTCWSLIQLLQHPDVLAEIMEEQSTALGGAPDGAFGLQELGKLKVLDWALKETQRMHPVMTHYARYNSRGYSFADYEIPKGWLTVICPAISHRDPDVFAQPDIYDPYRFSPEREEHKKNPYALIGFGAGLYRCPGAAFGVNEMKTVISLLLSRYTLKLLTPEIHADFEMGVVRPKPPCRIAYQRRNDRPIAVPRTSRDMQVVGITGRNEGAKSSSAAIASPPP
jgi:sterol 14-demethylase